VYSYKWSRLRYRERHQHFEAWHGQYFTSDRKLVFGELNWSITVADTYAQNVSSGTHAYMSYVTYNCHRNNCKETVTRSCKQGAIKVA